ncbi:MAG TPA: flagellar protein FlgN [Steroidobacteraceae bacterium]|nr:flagellar protein FlgN [Steroidobacteraceae bacterium]
MDAGLCREHLAELLGEEIVLLTELQQLLEEERDLIGSGEPEALQRTTRARQDRLGALARIEEQRRSLCTLHGETPDRAGLERLRNWCDPTGALSSRLSECLGRATRCRDLNDRNGIMVAARMKRVAELLQALTGRVARAATYGPRGYAASARTGRVLGTV